MKYPVYLDIETVGYLVFLAAKKFNIEERHFPALLSDSIKALAKDAYEKNTRDGKQLELFHTENKC